MGATLAITTGYGFTVTNDVLEAWQSMDEDADLWEFISEKYPLLDVEMATVYDYYPDEPDDAAYAVLVKESLTREYGVGVYSVVKALDKSAPFDSRYKARMQLVGAANELGIPAIHFGWYTVVSYG